ncbi:MAG: phosphate ABC transporter substrate-binding protein, partial [Acidimicrobiaceae bacterium]|nr:phosphate ABC transporter substrate-binding protein [Acidimicrobiaceae bacterium]
MNTYVASLSMYDWPEVRDEVDALWSAIGARLSDAGVDAPEALTRTDRFDDLWTHPGLLVGQACGLNVAEGLRGASDTCRTSEHAAYLRAALDR